MTNEELKRLEKLKNSISHTEDNLRRLEKVFKKEPYAFVTSERYRQITIPESTKKAIYILISTTLEEKLAEMKGEFENA